MKKSLLISVALILALQPAGAGELLDGYVRQGLAGNLALQQETFALDKSLEALKEARAMFLPNLSLQARYSRAGGGRVIEFPVGDLFNPVYKSLNELFRFHGISAGFPTDLPNEIIPFLREREQETKLRVVQPILRPALVHNLKIRSHLTKAEEARLDAFRKRLVADIRIAYFNAGKARRMLEILAETRTLLEENLRISGHLYDLGKATEDIVFRARAELASLERETAAADRQSLAASAYFNFLLNRDLDAEIEFEETPVPSAPAEPGAGETAAEALAARDEFRQLDRALDVRKQEIKLASSAYLPSLAAVVDYGIQGPDYRLGRDDDYWMASLVFEWSLFDGGQRRSRKARAELETREIEARRAELESRIRLQVSDAARAFRAALKAVDAARAAEAAAKRALSIVRDKYEHGAALQIEFLEARTAWTAAAAEAAAAGFEALERQTEYEWAAGRIDPARYESKEEDR
jgi:outer membrane protein